MRRRFALPPFALAALLALAPPALAILPPTRPQVLLYDARTPDELRATLAAFGDSAAASSDAAVRLEAGEAFALLGQSWFRAGLRDSAIAAYRRAVQLRAAPADAAALADAMMFRPSRSDLEGVIALLEGAAGNSLIGHPRNEAERAGRIAWARFALGDSAALRSIGPEYLPYLEGAPEWHERMGRMRLGVRDAEGAIAQLLPLVAESRRQDRVSLQRLQFAWEQAERRGLLDQHLEARIASRDSAVRFTVLGLGARRVSFKGADGAPVGGVVTGLAAARRRAAVVLLPHDESVANADTLARVLERAGYAAVFVDPRGARASVSADCSNARSWRGREDEMQLRVADDVRPALRALARTTPVDTSRFLLVGVGAMAPVAVGAAWLDPRAAVLMLVSPWPAAPDRGPMRAALAALARPVFLQTAPEHFDAVQYANRLADACDPRLVRVSDGAGAGMGAAVFRGDPASGERFVEWVRDQWAKLAPAPAAKPAPRRAVPGGVKR
jgi:hypothetical protein